MPKVFADTSGWGNLLDKSQQFHDQAVSIYRQKRGENNKFITTNYVLAELIALLNSPLRMPRKDAIGFIESLKSSAFVEIVHVDEKTDEAAWKLLKSRVDKNWSLVDCSSFVIMNQEGITEAFCTDYHFEQAGFVNLIK